MAADNSPSQKEMIDGGDVVVDANRKRVGEVEISRGGQKNRNGFQRVRKVSRE